MAESSRKESGELTPSKFVDLKEAVRLAAENLEFDFDPKSDPESDPPSSDSDTEYDESRIECRELGLQGGPADYYIQRIGMPSRQFVKRERKVAQRERRIARHMEIEWDTYQRYADEYQKKYRKPMPPMDEREEGLYRVGHRNLLGKGQEVMPEDLVDREFAIDQKFRRLGLREYEVAKLEYIVANSYGDPAYFLREHGKVLSTKRKLDKKLSTALAVREDAMAALEELPVLQKKLKNAEDQITDLDGWMDYGKRNVKHLEEVIEEKNIRENDTQMVIKQYKERETHFRDILRDEKHALHQEMLKLETRLFPLEEAEPKKQNYIRELKLQVEEHRETIKELTDYADKTEKELEVVRKFGHENKEKAKFYNDLFTASHEAAEFHGKEAEVAKKRLKDMAESDTRFVDARYELAQEMVTNLNKDLAETLARVENAEEEAEQARTELKEKEEELHRVNFELDQAFGHNGRLSVSTDASGSARANTNLQDELDADDLEQNLSFLTDRVAELESAVEAKTAEVEHHKAKLEAKESEMDEACKQLKAKTTELNNLTQTISELTKTADQVRASAENGRKELAARSAKYEADYAKLYRQHDQLRKDCNESVQKINRLQARQHEKTVEIQKQLADAQIAATDSAAENKANTQHITALTAELAKTKADAATKLENLEKDYSALSDEKETASAANQANIEKIAKLEAHLAQTEADIAAKLKSMQEDHELLKGERDKIAEELESLVKDTASSKDEHDKMRKDFDKLLSDNVALELYQEDNAEAPSKLIEMGHQLALTERNLSAAKMTNAARDEDIKELKLENNTQKAAIKELEEQLLTASNGAAELERLRTANAKLELYQADNSLAPQKLLEMGQELIQAEHNLSLAKMTNVAKDRDIEELKLESDKQKAAMKVFEEQLDSAKIAAAEMVSSIADLKEQLTAAKNGASRMSARIAELEDQLEAAKNDAAGMESEMTELKEQLGASDDRNAELESKISGLEEQLKQEAESLQNKTASLNLLKSQQDRAAEALKKGSTFLRDTKKALEDSKKSLEDSERRLQHSKRLSLANQEWAEGAEADIVENEREHEKAMAEKQAEIEQLNNKSAKLLDEIARLEENQMDSDCDLAQFVEKMESGFDDLERAQDKANRLIVDRDQQISDLTADLEKSKDIANQMKSQLAAMENEIQELRELREQSDIAKRETSDQISNLHARLQQVLQQIKDSQGSTEQTVNNLNMLLRESQESAAKTEKGFSTLKGMLSECRAALLAEEKKCAKKSRDISELEGARDTDRAANFAEVKKLQMKLKELQSDVAKRAVKEKDLEDLVKSKTDNIEALEAEKQQSEGQSQRILDLEKALADMNEQQVQDGKAGLAAAEELQKKAADTEKMNGQLLEELMELTHKAGTWEEKEKELKEVVQLQANNIRALKDEGTAIKSQFVNIANRAKHDAETIENLKSKASALSAEFTNAARENEKLRQNQKDLDKQQTADSFCYTCGRGCECPITMSEVAGFLGQWWNVIRTIWTFLEIMPLNTKTALIYLLGFLMLPAQCWKPLTIRVKMWYRNQLANGIWPWRTPSVMQRGEDNRAAPDCDWPSMPTVPHASMVYSIICWSVIISILFSSLSYWSTSEERSLWLGANSDTRAYFNFARREGAPGACLVPQPLPVDFRFVYEPAYGNLCGFVERQTGFAVC